jgi:hypothetical protein
MEHLVAADRAVASLRKILLRAADDVEKGASLSLPPDLTDVGAPDVFLLKQERKKWHDLTPNHWQDDSEVRGVSFETNDS